METVYVVFDKSGTLVGIYTNEERAQEMANHDGDYYSAWSLEN